MLTKDLLRFQIRGDRVHPSFVRCDDPSALASADEMISTLGEAAGTTMGEAEEALAGFVQSHRLAPAFQKLLLGRVDEEEDDGSIAEHRKELIQVAQRIRRTLTQGASGFSQDDFRSKIADALNQSFPDVGDSLYSDLPQARRIAEFKTTTAEQLLHRYNCALVQGLLLHSRNLSLTIGDASISQKRRFFRMIKFSRLLCEFIEPEAGQCQLRLSGPLSLFQNAQAYGLRMALFFPHVLHLPRWKLVAEVHLRDRTTTLTLDQTCGIQSHYEAKSSYIPPEFSVFVESFNKPENPWRASESGDPISLGHESYCVPDLVLNHSDGRKIHIELFHKWHAGQLIARLEAAEKKSLRGLLLGVSSQIAKDPAIREQLSKSRWFEQNGFEFRDFPTPRTVLSLLK